MEIRFLDDGRARLWLERLHLNPEEKTKVEDCIARYTGVGPCWSACFESIIYQIINAVKAIFCVSDWQNARKIVQGRVSQIAIERGLVQNDPQNDTERTIRSIMDELTWKIADKYMNGCLQAELDSCVLIPKIRPTVVDLNDYLEARIRPEVEDLRRMFARQIPIEGQRV